jgi:UDP-4-amino-4,6-dideoxy-N-acetyl-beta-L-altrosamine transaminase
MNINKFIPYAVQYIDEDDIRCVTEALRSAYLTTGPAVDKFEKKICEVTGAAYAVAVANGTAALHLASLALLEPGDEVLTTPNSFVATSNSVIYSGARPVFTDILENGNIDLARCEKILEADSEKRIKAVYAVHFSGNPVDQDKLRNLREKFGVKILEDCAHSLGAVFSSGSGTPVRAGSCENSDCSILSFHPVKHVTTGEGGAITTNSAEIYHKLLMLRAHGINRTSFVNKEMAFDEKGNSNPWYYEMQTLGFNYRITDFQCALGVSQLDKLDKFVAARRRTAQRYDEYFKGAANVAPLYSYNGASSYHLYVVKIDFKKIGLTRAEFLKKLKEKNIGAQLHYIPINRQPYYLSLGYGAEHNMRMDEYYSKCLSIPMYYSLSEEEAAYVAENILKLTKV